MPVNPTPAEGVVVPIYPTEAMLDAAHGVPVMTFEGKPVYTTSREAEAIYRAMLAARPSAPTQSAAQTGEVTRDWLVSVVQQHTFAQDAADMILAALSQPEQSQ